MKLPTDNNEVLVKLDNGKFAVAQYQEREDKWYAGSGIFESHENGLDVLSGNVVSWSKLPEVMENEPEIKKNKNKM